MIAGGVMLAASHWLPAADDRRPVILAIDAEFGVPAATSAQAIQRGAELASAEINAAGGVLPGRPLEIVARNNNSMPARARDNLTELSGNPDVVAVMSGKHSPVVQQLIPLIHELGMPYLVPWAAADDITDNRHQPNFVFRLSLRDSWAMAALIQRAEARGYRRLGLLIPNNGWGRSNLAAIEEQLAGSKRLALVSRQSYNMGHPYLHEQYEALLNDGAEVLILVGNELEGVALVDEISGHLPADRLPVLSHWGVTGGEFFERTGEALKKVDFSVVQTFSFVDAKGERVRRIVDQLRARWGVASARDIDSPVGVAQAYDLTHLLALAVRQAGSTDRAAVRAALEQIPEYAGLIRRYRRPFTPARHDALDPSQVFVARYAPDGAIVRAAK
ncbi:MAG TPA: ABC transporter substrate-binding protein [Aromatoleum sp.]|uniref:ABC transporter substrate-binding protein n=1 Tax=Aromatoleum sp. TaxID=2307007 RepID=UPI002B45C724|nr:ABC transporter substrate-binding protein [Aromatoleum sp.]HJV25429.1 ABC transporter substrate-binding protein [Aromatoleum sp.]